MLSFTSCRAKMFSLIFRRAMGNLWFSRLHHLLQVNSPNRVHNLKHTVSLLLFLPWLLSWMTHKWDVEILFCVESHVFAKVAKSLKASEGKLSWIAADTFLSIIIFSNSWNCAVLLNSMFYRGFFYFVVFISLNHQSIQKENTPF